jgi:hypothetical protein
MVRTRFNHGWSRRGFALLWDAEVLGRLCPPRSLLSLRELFALVGHWPEDLPAAAGGRRSRSPAGFRRSTECASAYWNIPPLTYVNTRLGPVA